LLVAFSVTFALTPLTIVAGLRWGFVDYPSERKIHRVPTPRIGGLAVFVGVVSALFANAIVVEWMLPILGAGSFLLLVGVLDDLREVPAWGKLVAQLLATGIVIASGKAITLFPAGVFGNVVNMALTVLWIVGITNAFNFFDGLDGLAAGLAVLIAGFLGAVAFETNQPALGWFAVAIVGAGLGFLPFNFRVEKDALVFLGDGGSTVLGFTLACLAVAGNWAEHNPMVSFSNPLLIFGILIYDMIHVTVERILTGKVTTVMEWLTYVGQDHLHHRLARLLGSRLASVGMIWALTVCLGLGAIVLRKAGTVEAVLLLIQAALVLIMITILEHRGRTSG
jgi:UDP-GlcNAc:undecaprenyl-phosphate GlcNAc-1-phosphate transferase